MSRSNTNTNKRTRSVATRKNARVRRHAYADRVPIITDALYTLGGRATPSELFAGLRTDRDGLFYEERRISATYRQYVRNMENPPFERDGKYFVLTKRQRRISDRKSRRSKSNRKLTRGLRVDPEVDGNVKAFQERSTGRSSRQGFNVPVDARIAIENLAMKRATAHFSQQGWKVEDVHERKSYDLRCLKRSQELRVEVKGTSAAGSEIILTPKEVAHARKHFPNVALYVLADIDCRSTGGRYRAKGGREFIKNPWRIDDGKLKPLSYTYKLPGIRSARSQERLHASR